MDFQLYRKLVSEIPIGKKLPDSIYLHRDAFNVLPKQLYILVSNIIKGLKIRDSEWNIAKFQKRDFRISLLNYPDFDTYAYPSLHQSINIDLDSLTVRKTDYRDSNNAPILHRKETFVTGEYPLIQLFRDITKEGEEAGLYEKVKTIGFKNNWLKLIKQKGLYLDTEGRLKGDIHHLLDEEIEIQRHLTAIDRDKLSSPMQLLSKFGYLDGSYSIFDYGCGKGDDVRELEAHGLDIGSYDPVYHPEGELHAADIVNLGFVINVIEDKDERIKTINRAFELTNKALVVSAMVAGEALISRFTPYKDGVVTSKKTFQKYYSQSELKEFISFSLGGDYDPIAIGQGVFIVFKEELDLQSFLLERNTVQRTWNYKTAKTKISKVKDISSKVIEENKEVFEDFWSLSLNLGRCPANSEFDQTDLLRKVANSHKKAFEALTKYYGKEEFDIAVRLRKEDLIVYFALGLFEKRKPYIHMPERLQRDIKAFFNSVTHAKELATQLLFSLSNEVAIQEACEESYARLRVGEFNIGHSYTFPISQLTNVTPELRVYIGCASQLLGDISDYHLVKAHITSGKVSFMKYDDWKKEQPLLIERAKVKLRNTDIDFFDYVGEYTPPPLLNKDIFLNEISL